MPHSMNPERNMSFLYSEMHISRKIDFKGNLFSLLACLVGSENRITYDFFFHLVKMYFFARREWSMTRIGLYTKFIVFI